MTQPGVGPIFDNLAFTKVVEDFGGYVDHPPYIKTPKPGTVQYSVQMKAYNLELKSDYDLEFEHRMRALAEKWSLVEEWRKVTDTNLMDEVIITGLGSSSVGRSMITTLSILAEKGWKLVALYVLRYVQDYGWTPQQAWPYAYQAVWGDTPEDRADATPGIAAVEQTFYTQQLQGQAPAHWEWDYVRRGPYDPMSPKRGRRL